MRLQFRIQQIQSSTRGDCTMKKKVAVVTDSEMNILGFSLEHMDTPINMGIRGECQVTFKWGTYQDQTPPRVLLQISSTVLISANWPT